MDSRYQRVKQLFPKPQYMVKSFTLEDILDQHNAKEAKNKESVMPKDFTINLIMAYSRALQVFNTRKNGTKFIVLN